MQLSLLNQSVVVKAALGDCTDINPRFGITTRVNDAVFKYIPHGELRQGVLIERLDIGEFLKGIPQDISQVTYKETPEIVVSLLQEKLGVVPEEQEPIVQPSTPLVLKEDDPHTTYFELWRSFVGLPGLYRHEVDLGLVNDTLIIDARYSTIYKGNVTVKVK